MGRTPFFLSCLIVLLTLLLVAWSVSFRAPYLFDDYRVPVSDPASRSLQAWTNSLPETLRPLTKLSFAIESELGLREAPARRLFHFVILFFSAALVGLIARRIHLSPVTSLLMACFFIAHPLHADNFILLSGRSALLEQFFLLLACALYFQANSSVKKTMLVICFSLLGLFSRETSFLAVLFLILSSVQQPQFSGRQKIGLITGLVVAFALPFLSPHFRKLLIYSLDSVGTAEHLGLQFAGLSRGLVWILAPFQLTIDHDFSITGWLRLFWILGSIILCILIIRNFFRTRSASASLLLLGLLILLPTQSFVGKIDPLTERPFATALPFLLLGTVGFFTKYSLQPVQKKKLALAFCLLIAFFTFVTRQRSFIFLDELTIWQEAANHSTTSTRPLVNLGTLLVQKGRYDEALFYFRQAQARNPIDFDIQQKIQAALILKSPVPQ